ncbi:hypothetical protein SDC9_100344 [bioreactor metagenome]|uniref:Uncharacterized protein n=1 Tax=bioreactor metagenome TaxID=1076179 RepID=A0A645AKW6_9ZZZZ
MRSDWTTSSAWSQAKRGAWAWRKLQRAPARASSVRGAAEAAEEEGDAAAAAEEPEVGVAMD